MIAPSLDVGFKSIALTVALDECGILKRISYVIIKRLGGSYNATLYAIYIVGVVLGQLCFCGHYFLMIGFVYHEPDKSQGYKKFREIVQQ